MMTHAADAWSTSAIKSLLDETNGTLDPRIYSDQALYDLEQERLFGRSWLFLGHDAHVPKPGDYLATYMGEDPVLLVRQKDGSVRAFLNQCRHRGMKICRSDAGNARSFTCSYHGWAYDIGGNLVNVPLENFVYSELDKSAWSPIPVPKLENYKGLIFGNWDKDAPSLTDWLGDATFYMDTMLDRADGGTTVIGGMHKWVIPCNWKFAAEQFCSDMYHVASSHMSAFVAMAPEDARPEDFDVKVDGRQFRAEWGGHGSGFFLAGPAAQAMLANTVGERVAQYWCVDSAAAAESRIGTVRAREISSSHMTVFPNLSFLPGINAIRTWNPRGPAEIEVWAFTLVDANAPDEIKESQRKSTLRAFSAGGIFEQDDGENWVEIQRVLRGYQARQHPFNIQMGKHNPTSADAQFPGRIGFVMGEEAARGFYSHWVRMMTEPDWSTLMPGKVGHAV